jgi:hypothetical protein
MRFTIRDLFWATLVIALAVALWLQTRRYQDAAQEAENRTIENDYWVKQVLKLEEELSGTADNPKLPTR